MNAFVFPGQGAQYPGMGKKLYDSGERARIMFEQANKILGFSITDIMFGGTDADLRQTRVTQPAIFLHSVILAEVLGSRFNPAMVAGHSLGEFSALVTSGVLEFGDGLRLVSARAKAMQKACEARPSTMAAVIGLDDSIVEEICNSIDDIIVPANYNTIGQLVVSGTTEAIDKAITIMSERGARRALKLSIGGAFHSPLMEPARAELEDAISSTPFKTPLCPIYQNATALPSTDPSVIKLNLIAQLTSPVRWTQTVINMVNAGATRFTELGPGNVLQGLIRKTAPGAEVSSASSTLNI